MLLDDDVESSASEPLTDEVSTHGAKAPSSTYVYGPGHFGGPATPGARPLLGPMHKHDRLFCHLQCWASYSLTKVVTDLQTPKVTRYFK